MISINFYVIVSKVLENPTGKIHHKPVWCESLMQIQFKNKRQENNK